MEPRKAAYAAAKYVSAADIKARLSRGTVLATALFVPASEHAHDIDAMARDRDALERDLLMARDEIARLQAKE